MKIVISPAKKLDIKTPTKQLNTTNLKFSKEAKDLINGVKKLKPIDLIRLMKISPKLAELNYFRFQNWNFPFTSENAKAAVFAFNGDVYQGLHIENMNSEDINFAQKNLRILSGLYGILKPLDLIQAYRLEMGIKLKTDNAKNLYDFWGDKITNYLNEEFSDDVNPILINLASNEYFKVIKTKKLKAKIIQPQFKEEREGKFKIISFYAKKARGLMTRFIIQNKIENPEAIKAFDFENYRFDENLSDDKNWIFTR